MNEQAEVSHGKDAEDLETASTTLSRTSRKSPQDTASAVSDGSAHSMVSTKSLKKALRRSSLDKQLSQTQLVFSRRSTLDASAKAELFQIRVPVPGNRHQQLLRAAHTSPVAEDDEGAKKACIDEILECLPQSLCRRFREILPVSLCERVLMILAVLAVVVAPFQLAVEPMCHQKWEMDVMLAGKGSHLICSVVYVCLAMLVHLSTGKNLSEDPGYIPSDKHSSSSSRRLDLKRGLLLDAVSVGGLIAEMVHLGEVPNHLPSGAQWFWLLHMCKVWRVFAGQQHGPNSESGFSFHVQVLVLFGWLALVAHIFACTMAAIATLEQYSGIKTFADLFLEGNQAQCCFDFYIGSLYFSTYTLTGTGYGDIVPVNTMERIPTVIFMLFAQMYSAKIIANLNWITSMHQYWYTTYCEKKTQMQAALSSLNVPKSLCQRILAYQDFIEDAKKETRVRGCISDLSRPLQEELKLQTFHNLVTCAPFLKAQPIEVLRIIVSSLEDQVFLPGDVIFRRGDSGVDIYFMRSGKAGVFPTVEMPSWDDTEVATIKAGSYFGERSWLTDSGRQAWIIARTYAVCSVLEKTVMDRIVADHPSCFVSMILSLKDSCKLTPSLTWQEISDRVASKFQDVHDLMDFVCSEEEDDAVVFWSRFQQLMQRMKVPPLDQKLKWAELDQDRVGWIAFEMLENCIGGGVMGKVQPTVAQNSPGPLSSRRPTFESNHSELATRRPSKQSPKRFMNPAVRSQSRHSTRHSTRTFTRTFGFLDPDDAKFADLKLHPQPPDSTHQDHQMQNLMTQMSTLTQRVDAVHSEMRDLAQYVKALTKDALVVPFSPDQCHGP
eukprot:gnl/MRDRNA2_/MRDRNA2_59231_c1_seq1.p1 gnl/MRDRNA2_/MRDRNA2_59231_c1~~gnl/MRDRNA2_/MRDRNA2_59231_c1_seq1.p1  ORF type:complete len:832 (+),score=133.53 gnl/MRDRNA2_/MRDRNA2_59231_c1_seq1:280-2775(+)